MDDISRQLLLNNLNNVLGGLFYFWLYFFIGALVYRKVFPYIASKLGPRMPSWLLWLCRLIKSEKEIVIASVLILISFAVANVFVDLLVRLPSENPNSLNGFVDKIVSAVPVLAYNGLIGTMIWVWGAIFIAFSKYSPMLKKMGVFMLILTPLFIQFFFVWACLKYVSLGL